MQKIPTLTIIRRCRIIVKEFEWDEVKAESNFKKHGVAFEHASGAWLDPYYKEWQDTRRDYDEARYIRLAIIENHIYHVSFAYRSDVIRIISARRALKNERREYEAP